MEFKKVTISSALIFIYIICVAMTFDNEHKPGIKNVLGTELQACSNSPLTGFFRNGYCDTGCDDYGVHVVCAKVNEDFLAFTKAKGNDLSTPRPEYNFSGLKPGDKWCLCASRWKEAYEEGHAPEVDLESTHEDALKIIPFEMLLDMKLVKDE